MSLAFGPTCNQKTGWFFISMPLAKGGGLRNAVPHSKTLARAAEFFNSARPTAPATWFCLQPRGAILLSKLALQISPRSGRSKIAQQFTAGNRDPTDLISATCNVVREKEG